MHIYIHELNYNKYLKYSYIRFAKIHKLLFIQTLNTHTCYATLLFPLCNTGCLLFIPTSLLVPLMGITKLSSIIGVSILLTKIIIGAEHNAITTLTKQNAVKRKDKNTFTFNFQID